MEEKQLTKEDLKRIIVWFKNSKSQVWILLLIFTMLVSCDLRMEPQRIGIAEDWAKEYLKTYILSDLSTEISANNPNLPQEKMDSLLKQRAEAIDYRKYSGQLEIISEQFRAEFKDEDGTTYLVGIDPFYWVRHAENILDHGNPGDEQREDGWYDNHMYAPNGRKMPTDMFHAYFLAMFYTILNAVLGWSLMKSTFYSPIFLVALSCIPAFMIAKRWGGNIAGTISALWIAINPAFLVRTTGGFADTDPYSVLMPLLITWAFFEAHYVKRLWLKILLGSLSGFCLGLFGFAWIGWSFVFDIMVGTIFIYGAYLGYIYFKDRTKLLQLKEHAYISLSFLVSSFLFLSWFRDIKLIGQALLGPLWFIRLKEVAVSKIWPNVLTTVAEQNDSSIGAAISAIGGNYAVILLITCLIFLIWRKHYMLFIWMVLFILATTFAGARGVRYVQLMLPAVAIGLGLAYAYLVELASASFSKIINVNRTMVSAIIVILLVIGFIPTIKAVSQIRGAALTDFDDAWYDALNKIKLESEPDAIITSWWDFGHWFKEVADRAVTFDGTSQDSPQAHWVGKALQTSNEKESIAILRMLACGGNEAYDYILKNSDMSELDAKIWLDKLLLLNKTEATSVINSVFVTSDLLKFTHCDPPEVYLITSTDMIGKAPVWAHFGLWDFKKAQIYQDISLGEFDTYESISDSELTELRSAATSIPPDSANDWISPWPSYYTGWGECVRAADNITINCINNLGEEVLFSVNLLNMTTQGLRAQPDAIVYLNTTSRELSTYANQESEVLGASLLLSPAHGNRFVSKELASSIFTRLFLLNATGLKHFEQFTEKQSPFGWDILVWKVKW